MCNNNTQQIDQSLNQLEDIDANEKVICIGPDFLFYFLSSQDCERVKHLWKTRGEDFYKVYDVDGNRIDPSNFQSDLHSILYDSNSQIDWTQTRKAFDILAKKKFSLYINFSRLNFLEEAFEKLISPAIFIKKNTFFSESESNPFTEKEPGGNSWDNHTITSRLPFIWNVFDELYKVDNKESVEFQSARRYAALANIINTLARCHYPSPIKRKLEDIDLEIVFVGFDWDTWYWNIIFEFLAYPPGSTKTGIFNNIDDNLNHHHINYLLCKEGNGTTIEDNSAFLRSFCKWSNGYSRRKDKTVKEYNRDNGIIDLVQPYPNRIQLETFRQNFINSDWSLGSYRKLLKIIIKEISLSKCHHIYGELYNEGSFNTLIGDKSQFIDIIKDNSQGICINNHELNQMQTARLAKLIDSPAY
ncbi:MAG: hypothetical protein JEZ14_08205 [Marinilabiliaceae bacterium]|nr:hypothetical protein [Marinilabiliaceae bacterium]